MQVIEFKTKVIDGIIKIPDKYDNFKNDDLHIIIIKEESDIKDATRDLELKKFSEFQHIIENNEQTIDKKIDLIKQVDEVNIDIF